MPSRTTQKKNSLKDFDTFFDKDKRISLEESDLSKVQDVARYTWSQIEQLKEDPKKFEEQPNNLSETGIVNAAFTKGGTTFLFSGDEIYAYSGDYEFVDAGHPVKLINSSPDFPKNARIDAAFHGPDGRTYFFDNQTKTFSRSDDLSIRQRISQRWGGTIATSFGTSQSDFITAGLTIGQRTYLFTQNEMFRYTGSIYQFIDVDYPIRNTLHNFLNDIGIVDSAIIRTISSINEPIMAAITQRDKIILKTLNEDLFQIDTNNGRASNPHRIGQRQSRALIEGMFAGFSHNEETFIFKDDKLLVQSENNIHSLQNIVNGSFIGLDGNLYLFLREEFFSIPVDQVNTHELLRQLSNPLLRPQQERWAKISGNQITTIDEVDAAIVRNGSLFLFSGEEYLRYTHIDQEFFDHGYPKRIQGNPDGFPDVERIDAAFTGFDGKEYYFDNQRQEFRTSDDLSISFPTQEKWGKSKVHQKRPDGGFIGAAFIFENFSYLLNPDSIIKYENGDDGFIDLLLHHELLAKLSNRLDEHQVQISDKMDEQNTRNTQVMREYADIMENKTEENRNLFLQSLEELVNRIEAHISPQHREILEAIEESRLGSFERLEILAEHLLAHTIKGLDPQLLKLAEQKISGRGDGRISEADAKEIVKLADQLGDSLSEEERTQTLAFIISKHKCSKSARTILVNAFT
ncbi:MAG: hemopexin repeat-containing protein [Bacteroidia bacterium]|nr:hemopexin repeat-containing protein [Bacteroidia bacterium]